MEMPGGTEIGRVHHVYPRAGALIIRNERNLHVHLQDTVRIESLEGSFPIKSLEVSDVDRAEIFPEDNLFGLVAAGLPLGKLRRKKVFLVVAEKKELVGRVTHIYPRLGVFATTAQCCLLPGQIISVEGIAGLHTVESLEVKHIRHNRINPGDEAGIKAGVIPAHQLRYGARIWLHEEAEANHAGSQPAVPQPEHDEPHDRFSLDG